MYSNPSVRRRNRNDWRIDPKSWLRSSFTNGEVSFGMYRAIQVNGRWEKEFVSWDTCPLHVESIQRMIARLKLALPEQALAFTENSLVGLWVGSPHLVVISRGEGLDEMRGLDWQKILAPPFNRVWFHRNSQVGRNVFGHHEIQLVFGPSELPHEGIHPIRAFRQVAQTLLLEARKKAFAYLLDPRPELVLDLYCGTGDLLLAIPPEVRWLGIELSGDAVKYANSIQRPSGAPHAAFVGTVEHRLRDPRVAELIHGRLSLYVNPPRSGLSEEARYQVIRVINEKAPEKIAYLSCSASSLGRDLRAFETAGYTVENLQPYDFFPQTEHFETLALLRRKSAIE